MNEIHPTLKFTMNHTTPESEAEEDSCDCEKNKSIPFLDTEKSIENGRIEVDLHRKKTHFINTYFHLHVTPKQLPKPFHTL